MPLILSGQIERFCLSEKSHRSNKVIDSDDPHGPAHDRMFHKPSFCCVVYKLYKIVGFHPHKTSGQAKFSKTTWIEVLWA